MATDEQGRFSVSNCAVRHVEVELRRPGDYMGWVVARFEGVHPTEEALVLTVPSQELHDAQLTGTLVGPDGGPLATAELFAVARSGGDGRALLDPVTGSFRFTGLPSGTYDVLAWASGRPPAWVVTAELGPGEVRELGELRLPR